MVFLLAFVIVMFILVFGGYINEKFLKLPTEIALLIISFCIGLLYILISYLANPNHLPVGFPIEYFSDILVNGLLCFMLFSGASNITFRKVKRNVKAISLLALVTTTLSTFLFGFISYCMLTLLGYTQFSLLEMLLFGAIISPTDPIAATSILKKVGLSKELNLVIEGESLFNDGVGIAIFVAISRAMSSTSKSINVASFFLVLMQEIFGAIGIALVISFILSYFFKKTKDRYRQIFISVLALTSSYVACQYLHFSSAISAVVCGIYFATIVAKESQKEEKDFQVYEDFWKVIDNLLNYLLYIVLGLFFVNLFLYAENNLIYIAVVTVTLLVSRYLGVFAVSFGIKPIPESLSRNQFSMLLTWAGLKGGLSLALMIESSRLLATDKFHTMIICVFAIVLFTTVFQGLSVDKFYKRITKQ